MHEHLVYLHNYYMREQGITEEITNRQHWPLIAFTTSNKWQGLVSTRMHILYIR